MAAAPVYFGTIRNYAVRIADTDGTSTLTLYTVPTNGGVVESIAVSGSDTAARDVSLIVGKSGADRIIGTKTIPITAGQIAATPAVDLLNLTEMPWARVDANGNRVLYLENGSVLKVKALVTLTAGKFIDFFIQVREV
jgi:hypothetical protein